MTLPQNRSTPLGTISKRHFHQFFILTLSLISIKTSIEVSVTLAEVGQLQYLPIQREFWQDPEREQHRKTYTEETYTENFFIAIRCPDGAQTCATIAKE